MSKLEDALISDFINKGTPIPEWVKELCHKAGAKIDFEELQPSFPEEETEEEPEIEEPQSEKKNGEDSGSELEEEVKELRAAAEAAMKEAATETIRILKEAETKSQEEDAAAKVREGDREKAIKANQDAIIAYNEVLDKSEKKPEDTKLLKELEQADQLTQETSDNYMKLLKEQAERE